MHNIITIVKKELARFFGDKKLFLTTVILPGLMIYLLYSFMGGGLMNQFEGKEDYVPKIAIYNMPASLESNFVEAGVQSLNDGSTIDNDLIRIENKEIDVVVNFPENFDQSIADGTGIPQVEVYYNSTNAESNKIYNVITATLNNYESSISNVFDVNGGTAQYDLASEKDITGQIFSSMLPMLLMIFIFSGCMGVAPESIAGEKERGTMATLLATPMKRGQLAIGKIISLSIISLLTGLSSFLGTILSLPKLMGGTMDGIGAVAYSVMDYSMLLLIVLSSILIIIAAISIISAYASSVKEASTAIMPLMVVVMFVGVSSLMIGSETPSIITALIPLYNCVVAMNGIFSFNYQIIYIVVTLVSNLVYTFILVFILTKMFNSEKCMF
ncbi:MAG: ABC transporter permease subunit [Anaerorhabdus sp.]|uniref:ABC transporter permease subunit n=1 Tax=Anaerorhabdus sp. TaxID=1872524 RepID=UPI002B21E439|nr:ABC transporter permease subunit [Anaerorhabdus sp.]MEA4875735.1 ABC transporter permease subunit [Anaerorhabdus sp.]